jgi:4'-phosphopantetheinyl transferase
VHAALTDDRRVDLWCVRPDEIADPALIDEYRRLLSPGEREREQRFRFEKDRLQHVVARALVRTVLSHYTGEDPSAWRFAPNAFGKPLVAGPSAARLQFNLAHTPGLVVCLVALGHEVGVDAEDLTRTADHLMLARRYFAASEAAALEALPPAERPAAFFRFWTLKEAYVKACGLGLSVPLGDFAFTLAADQPPRMSFAERVGDDPDRWQFAELRLAGRYQVALAVRRPAKEPLAVRVFETIPLTTPCDGRELPPNAGHQWFL